MPDRLAPLAARGLRRIVSHGWAVTNDTLVPRGRRRRHIIIIIIIIVIIIIILKSGYGS